jgi:hypothetical protein
MTSLLTKLFPGRTRTVRRPAATRPARTRLGLESLDSRCLLSVTPTLSAGVLTIQDDIFSPMDTVRVSPSVVYPDQIILIGTNGGNNAILVRYFNKADVTKIVFRGGQDETQYGLSDPDRAKDYYTNDTNIDSEFHAGAGNGTMKGGGGTNYFYSDGGRESNVGGTGTNLFYDTRDTLCDFFAGSGTNVLYRYPGVTTGHVSYIQDQSRVTAGPKLLVGQNPAAYTEGGLNVPGAMTVAFDPARKELTLVGPTGAGFRLRGEWTDTLTTLPGGQYSHTFKATSGVTVVTGSKLPDFTIPVTSALPLTITTKPNSLKAPIGEYDKLSITGGLNFGLPAVANPAEQVDLAKTLDDLGIGSSTAGFRWGLALGSELTSSGRPLSGAPLNAAVPYFYLDVGMSNGSAASVSYGNVTASVGSGVGASAAFDPADPFFYLKVATGTPVGTLAAGYSVKGVIPFTPLKPVDGVTAPVRGNLYLNASGVALGSLPASVSGEVVLDLDFNNDGNFVGGKLKDLFTKQAGGALSAAMNDVALGVNGVVELGYNVGGIDLSLPAGSATLVYQPGVLALRGGHDNMFAGTPLEKWAPKNQQVEIQGYVIWSGGGGPQWNASASVENQVTGALAGGKTTFTLDGYTITAKNTNWVDLRIASASVAVSATLGYDTTARQLFVRADMSAKLDASWYGFGIQGSMVASVDARMDQWGQVRFSGKAKLTGGVTVGLIKSNISVSANVDNNGFSLDVPFTDKDIRVNF